MLKITVQHASNLYASYLKNCFEMNDCNGTLTGLGRVRTLLHLLVIVGVIPSSIGNCVQLSVLVLSFPLSGDHKDGNSFTSSVPLQITMLPHLEILWAPSANIDGEFPRKWGNCGALKCISGEVPLRSLHLNSRVKCNFSFNNLSGLINHDTVDCEIYIGNPQFQSCQHDINGGKSGASTFELILIIVPSIIVIILVALIIIYLYRRNRRSKPNSVVALTSSRLTLPPHPHNQQELLVVFKELGTKLTLDTVVQATGNFTLKNCIGSGSFGSTYRAEISFGVIVVVKRLTASSSEMFLVYNYLPGGNLEKFILERRSMGVGLKILHKIALDVLNNENP
ncbi:LRR receptor-like serine/threonine-protein kinase RPK2 [Tanacetum coccineum]